MSASAAKRKLRQKPCSCGHGTTHWDPHKEGCPRARDTSAARAIRQALVERRHPDREGEWITLAEFSVALPGGYARRLDLFALRRWLTFPSAADKRRTGIPGRYYKRVAYEIKTDRADWRTEMRNSRKREPGLAFTHQFFFATPPGLVKKEEVPPECGLVTVEGDEVRVVKRAPIRRPGLGFDMHDVVALLDAKFLGRDMWAVRQDATRFERLLGSATGQLEAQTLLLDRARASMIRTHGHLLVAGSEWVGPWPWRTYGGRKQREDVAVRVTSVNVDKRYDDIGREHFLNAHMGTVYIEPVENDGDLGSQWIDPGDFLIAYRYVRDEPKPAPPESRLRRWVGKRDLRVLPGEGDSDEPAPWARLTPSA